MALFTICKRWQWVLALSGFFNLYSCNERICLKSYDYYLKLTIDSRMALLIDVTGIILKINIFLFFHLPSSFIRTVNIIKRLPMISMRKIQISRVFLSKFNYIQKNIRLMIFIVISQIMVYILCRLITELLCLTKHQTIFVFLHEIYLKFV